MATSTFEVLKVIQSGDLERHREMSRAGGRISVEKRHTRKQAEEERAADLDEIFGELHVRRSAGDERYRRESANEHIIPLSTYD